MRLKPVDGESNTKPTARETDLLFMFAVCVAAGVIGPRPVALIGEPTGIVRADLHHHFCMSKGKRFIYDAHLVLTGTTGHQYTN